MEPRRFHALERTELLGLEVPIARGLAARALGLALLDRERAGAGLLIPRCRCVHTFGMCFALDLLFLDGRGSVVALRRAVPPGRVRCCRRAKSVLELPSPWPTVG